jgi:hypothetical protein
MLNQKLKKVFKEVTILDHKGMLGILIIKQEVEVEVIVEEEIEDHIVLVEIINAVVVVVHNIVIIHHHLQVEMRIIKFNNNNK